MISILVFAFLFQCTWTKDVNNNVIAGAGCTAADIFVDAPHGDFRLRSPGSTNPAVGNALCLSEVPVDIDGVPRPNRGPTPGNSGCDLGAYQYVAPNPAPVAPKNLRIIGVTP